VDPDAVTAEFDNGVLEVRIPKPEESKPRRVAIKAHGENGRPEALEGTAEEK
jgi:HSP20 family protein